MKTNKGIPAKPVAREVYFETRWEAILPSPRPYPTNGAQPFCLPRRHAFREKYAFAESYTTSHHDRQRWWVRTPRCRVASEVGGHRCFARRGSSVSLLAAHNSSLQQNLPDIHFLLSPRLSQSLFPRLHTLQRHRAACCALGNSSDTRSRWTSLPAHRKNEKKISWF